MSRTLSDPRLENIPQHVVERLAQLLRRARMVAAIKGVAWTVAAFILGMLIGVAIDWFVPMLYPPAALYFTPVTRVIITSIVVLATVAIALWTLVRPLRHRYSLTALAMTLEGDHPELQERISTTVQLATSEDPDIFRGSEAMIHQVAEAADADSMRLNPRQIVRAARARRVGLAVGLVVVAVAIVAGMWPDRFGLYMQRFVAPWTETAQDRRTKVRSLTESAVVPRHERLTIEAESWGLRADEAVLYIDYEDGRREPPVSVRPDEADGLFRFTIARVADSFTYRIRANDGVTRRWKVTAIDRPQVARLDLAYDYPDYTGLPDHVDENTLGRVKAVRHTLVTARIVTNRPLEQSESALVLESEANGHHVVAADDEAVSAESESSRQVIPLREVSDRHYEATFEVMQSGQYYFRLSSSGLSNLVTPEQRRSVTAEPDTAPTIQIGSPQGQVTLRPNDRLPIGYDARDDFGLSRLRIRYSIDGREPRTIDQDLPAATGAQTRSRTMFDLGKLEEDLSAATRVEYQLQVADTLPEHFGGPQWGVSSRQTILLDSKVSDYAQRVVETLREEFADNVLELDKELRAALADVQDVLKLMEKVKDLDENQERRTDAAVGHLTNANDLAIKAAGRTDYSNYEKMGQRLRDIAASHIQPARKLTGESKDLAVQPQPRHDKLTQSEWHIRRALEKLNQVSTEFSDLIKVEDKAEQLMDLADKQQEVADKVADDRVIEDPKELAELTKEQLELLDKTKQMLAEEGEQAKEPLFDIAQKAEETLNEKIDQVAKQQEELAEQTNQAKDLADLEKQLDELAAKQKQLAEKGEDFQKRHDDPLKQADAPTDPAKAMKQAAEDIEKRAFDQAVKQQDQAIEKLDQAESKTKAQADEETKNVQDARQAANDAGADKEIAKQARNLQKQQQELAEQTAKAAANADKQQKEADAAAKQAESKNQALAKQQADLAKEFKKLQSDAKENLPKDDAAQAARRDGTPQAEASADQLKKNDPKSAEPQARAAADKASDMAKAMEQSAKEHDAAANKASAAAAAEKDADKKKAAQSEAASQKQQADAARKLASDADKVADAQKKLAEQVKAAAGEQAKADKAAAEADKAKRDLADLAKRQQHQAYQVNQLQKGMEQRNAEQRELARKQNPTQPAAEAGKQLADKPAEAQKQQAESAKRLGEMAEALEKTGAQKQQQADNIKQPYERMQQQQAASRNAKDLNAQQKQLAEQTKKAAAEYEKARKALTDQQLAKLTEEQKQLAKEAAKLADAIAQQPADAEGNPQPAKPNPQATRAAAEADQAARELGEQDLPEAQQQQEQAAQDLAKLAAEMADQADAQAAVDPEAQQLAAAQAQQAGKLAQRQQQLAQQAKNLMEGKPLANLPIQQKALEADTRELGEVAEMVADFLEQAAPEAGEMAREAAKQLSEKAPAAQQQATQQLEKGQMPQARQSQQQAAAAAQKAKEMFDQAAAKAAEQLAQAENAGEAAEPPAEAGEGGQEQQPNAADPLAEAAWAQRQAQAAMKAAQQGQQGEPSLAQQLAQAQAALAAQQASQQLAKAAQQASQQAQSMGSVLSLMPKGWDEVSRFSVAMESRTGSGIGSADLQRLNFELGISLSEWNRLPGYIQQEIVQASEEKVPQEYRELVKRYFRTISQQVSGETPTAPATPNE